MAKETIILVVFACTVFVLLVGIFVCLLVLVFSRQKRRLLQELQTVENKLRQELEGIQYEIQEHVLRLIGQEIHDNAGQLLTVAKINLNILSMEEGSSSRLLETKKQVGQALDELRHLSSRCNADILLDNGLLPAIKNQFRQLANTGLFRVSYHSEPCHVSLSATKMIFLCRMVQEALNNAVKHSCATELSGRTFCKDENLHIVIHDNGKGFSQNLDVYSKGKGLQSIRQRAEMIGATAAVHTRPEKGTTLHFICKYDVHDQNCIDRRSCGIAE